MEVTQDDFKEISKKAATAGLSISENSVIPLNSTGFMSKVYTAKTGNKEVVINAIKDPVPEQVFQKVPQKIKEVSDLLGDIDQVPGVYLTGSFGENGYFIVQEKKEGKPLGARLYENKKFRDRIVLENPDQYLEQLQNIIVKIHAHKSNTFGYQNLNQETSWERFLMKNSERCIALLEKAERDSNIAYFKEINTTDLLLKLRNIIQNSSESFSTSEASLIHGDILNYSNVLVNEDRISAVVDFEWSLWGHPAWEFVFNENPCFEHYLPQAIRRGIISRGIDFKKSIELHTIFWCLWGASVHASNPEFGPALFGVMREKLRIAAS